MHRFSHVCPDRHRKSGRVALGFFKFEPSYLHENTVYIKPEGLRLKPILHYLLPFATPTSCTNIKDNSLNQTTCCIIIDGITLNVFCYADVLFGSTNASGMHSLINVASEQIGVFSLSFFS